MPCKGEYRKEKKEQKRMKKGERCEKNHIKVNIKEGDEEKDKK